MVTRSLRPRAKPRRSVRLLSWDAAAFRGRVVVRRGRRVARFLLSLHDIAACEPMTRWRLKCLGCGKVRLGEVFKRGRIVECACHGFEKAGRCWHAAVIAQLVREGTFPAEPPYCRD